MTSSKRRKLLIAAGAAAGAAGIAGGVLWWRSREAELAEPPVVKLPPPVDFPNALLVPGTSGMFGVVDASQSLAIVARAATHAVQPGRPASMLVYEIEQGGNRFLNPVLRARRGSTFRARFWNALEEESIIHWHGLEVDSNNDGHPHYAVPGGATYDYNFPVVSRAATYWYHAHPHHLTGKQVHLGLAGVLIVEDDEELALQRALDLELGVSDIPLMLQDKRFDADGALLYAPDTRERVHGYLGAEPVVNLTPRPYFDAATRIYRFRLLNASNARLYRIAFRQDERLLDFHLIGSDGGLLDRPHTLNEAFLSSGERIDVLLDLRVAQVGDELTLVSLPFDAMHLEESLPAAKAQHAHHGAHETGNSQSVPADGSALDLLRIRIDRKMAYERAIPENLSAIPEPAADAGPPRAITLDQSKGVWRINGRSYDIKATPIVVKRGATEVWKVRNAARGMPHPFHIHGFQSRVLSRSGSPPQQQRLAVGANGLAANDLGWKDTLCVWPGETVHILTNFSHAYLGDQVYMLHCHNLEHADHGMMLNFRIAA
jgi:FtsP/CotA-like multicopper oxidase with cupredoxin domain